MRNNHLKKNQKKKLSFLSLKSLVICIMTVFGMKTAKGRNQKIHPLKKSKRLALTMEKTKKIEISTGIQMVNGIQFRMIELSELNNNQITTKWQKTTNM